MNAWNRFAAFGVIVAFSVLTATALPRTAFSMYDEGVYYYQSVLFARGQAPYRDFFVPQPPGLLLVGAACERIGAEITGVRAFNWLCGLVLLLQTYRLACRVSGQENESCAPLAPVLVAITVVFAYQSIQGATNMPAACLELTACVTLIGTRPRRFELAGVALAAATALRLQSLVATPGLLLLIALFESRAGFVNRAARFSAGLGVGCAAIHLPPAVLVPNYVNNVVGFHLDRVRTDWDDRRGQIRMALEEAPVVVGMVAAVWLFTRGRPAVRGVAAHGLLTTVLIAVAGNSLSVMYFLPVLPLFAACVTAAVPGRIAFVAPIALVLILALRGPTAVELIRALKAPDPEHAACIAAVRQSPCERVLTVDGRIAVLAGKELPADYYATDPNALVQLDLVRFHEWFERILPKADAVVVTSQLVGWMSRTNAVHMLASGKSLFFDEVSTRMMFEAKFQPTKDELPANWPKR